jgi:hypothetical protein
VTRQAPAGWYADPGEPGQLRWWDGATWAADTVAPDAGAEHAQDPAPAAPAPAPAAPAPAAPAPAAPAPEGAASAAPPATATRRPGTVWIWAAIVASVLPLYTGVFLDPAAAVRGIGGSGSTLTPAGAIVVALAALVIVDVALVAAALLFAWLDHRTLRRRGVEAPFGWGWAVLAFALTLGVYVVGRTVVVHRRTGRGLAPLWGWLAATLIGLVVFTVWVSLFSAAAWTAITTAR